MVGVEFAFHLGLGDALVDSRAVDFIVIILNEGVHCPFVNSVLSY
jgi:hypothetical protein